MGQWGPVFCGMRAAHLAASVVQDVGPPQASTPRWEKMLGGHPGFKGRLLETKQVPGLGAEPAFLSNSGHCRVTPTTPAPWRQLP